MKKTLRFHALVITAVTLLPLVARADLYTATQAFDAGNLPRAFELYRELAELGRLEAQQRLAAMYVNGEGVKRDNALGYAWAVIAREHGGNAAMKSIVEQLDPHMTEAARRRVAELQAQFGQEALRKRLLPAPLDAAQSKRGEGCTFSKPVNPDDYFPKEAVSRGLSGNVLLEYTILPDGRARNPRVWLAMPPGVFDKAGRQVAFNSTFLPRRENGVAVPCTMRIKVNFTSHGAGVNSANSEVRNHFETTKAKAQARDPTSQMLYGFLLSGLTTVKHEHENSLPWFVHAAQAGLPSAQFMVAMDLIGGYGAERDEDKGLAWLRMAAAAGQADAQVSLANYLLGKNGDATPLATALDLLERAVASGSHDGKFTLAALLAASPDATRRDPSRALVMIEQMMPEVDSDPAAFEIRAAAHAMLGNFEEAQRDQKTARNKARKYGWDLAPQQARLAAYEAKTPWTGTLIF